MIVMIENDIFQKRKYMLNTLMSRDKNMDFEIDSIMTLNDFDFKKSILPRFSKIEAMSRPSKKQ